MTPRKSSPSKGILPKLKSFWEALGDRYHLVLKVIDEALASDNLKEKIWAVDWILKRSPSDATELETETKSGSGKANKQGPTPEALQLLSDSELINRIRGHLKDAEFE